MQRMKSSPLTASRVSCRPTGNNRTKPTRTAHLTVILFWLSCGQNLWWWTDGACVIPTDTLIFSQWMTRCVWLRAQRGRHAWESVCVTMWVWVCPRVSLPSASSTPSARCSTECPFQLPVGHSSESNHGSELISAEWTLLSLLFIIKRLCSYIIMMAHCIKDGEVLLVEIRGMLRAECLWDECQ